ncbi:MAG TPA: HlyD family efflux transporter periplasmic adaptor subunit [Candidatus Dormibacteraeota bacterium]|nr:HlyD family efflux transporter periplasmic adaptor subunit [Candidatus Dormibacteraeota bacterium]
MDIARPELKRRKKIRRYIYGGVALVAVVLVTAALARLKPAAPSVDRSTVWTDTVKRGPMLREVRGLGTLVPETIQVVPAMSAGRVEKRFVLPGTAVKANTIILLLSDPQLQQETLDAEYQLKGAQASYLQTKANLENQLMDKRTSAANISSQYRTADMTKKYYEQLGKLGLKSELDVRTEEVQAEELAKENTLAQQEVQTFQDSIPAQLAVAQATVDQKQAMYALKKSQLDNLQVRAGIDGVLQELDVDVGQQVTEGAVLAKVAQPTQLKASLQIAETQAKDLELNQTASIDTHNGVIPGHVMRIDPAVVNGTRTVDVKLDGPLPPGAVPDLSVEGTILIQRLSDVLFVGRPVHGDPDTTVGLFKLSDDGNEAVRVPVALGRASVNTIEILKGLHVGDQVILSDMSAYDNDDRVDLK